MEHSDGSLLALSGVGLLRSRRGQRSQLASCAEDSIQLAPANVCAGIKGAHWKVEPTAVNFANSRGVRPSCGDCHIPKTNWFIETYTHVASGTRDLIAELTNNFDDPKIWEARRV